MIGNGFRYPAIRRRVRELKIAFDYFQKQIDAIYCSEEFLQAHSTEEFLALEKSKKLSELEARRNDVLYRYHVLTDCSIMHDGDRDTVIRYLTFVANDHAEILRGAKPEAGTIAEYICDAVEAQRKEARYMLESLGREWKNC